ncbi:hypothetical protein LTR28_009875, partial [Elasticomyces elasticus]
KFWEFSSALFDKQTDFFDVNVVNEGRNSTYKRLAKLAGSAGVDESKVLKLLEIPDKPGDDGSMNSGNGVTDDIKQMVKANRLGIVENSISSSFTKEQWEEWLGKNIV